MTDNPNVTFMAPRVASGLKRLLIVRYGNIISYEKFGLTSESAAKDYYQRLLLEAYCPGSDLDIPPSWEDLLIELAKPIPQKSQVDEPEEAPAIEPAPPQDLATEPVEEPPIEPTPLGVPAPDMAEPPQSREEKLGWMHTWKEVQSHFKDLGIEVPSAKELYEFGLVPFHPSAAVYYGGVIQFLRIATCAVYRYPSIFGAEDISLAKFGDKWAEWYTRKLNPDPEPTLPPDPPPSDQDGWDEVEVARRIYPLQKRVKIALETLKLVDELLAPKPEEEAKTVLSVNGQTVVLSADGEVKEAPIPAWKRRLRKRSYRVIRLPRGKKFSTKKLDPRRKLSAMNYRLYRLAREGRSSMKRVFKKVNPWRKAKLRLHLTGRRLHRAHVRFQNAWSKVRINAGAFLLIVVFLCVGTTIFSGGASTAGVASTKTKVPTWTLAPINTSTPSSTPSATLTAFPSPVPSQTPSSTVTLSPTATATETPTEVPTEVPTEFPTETPTFTPSSTMTSTPTATATEIPLWDPLPTSTPPPTNTPRG